MKKINKKKHRKWSFKNRLGTTPLFMIILLLVSAIALVVILSSVNKTEKPSDKKLPANKFSQTSELKQFKSADEFIAYLDETENLSSGYYGFGVTRNLAMPEMALDSGQTLKDTSALGYGGGGEAGRVSDTNVQVLGIDEPDIVKTNGQQIFFSSLMYYYYRTVSEPMAMDIAIDNEGIFPPPEPQVNTRVIDAWPVEDLALNTEIPVSGNLLLSDDNLLIFNNQDIYGYDVSDPANPSQKWQLSLGKNTYLVTSRLYDNQLYLVTQQTINRARPCPIEPIFWGDKALNIACSDIYYPVYPNAVDSTFTAMSVDPETGQVADSVSFVGASYSSVVYMSDKALYASYRNDINVYDFMYDFLNTALSDLLPNNLLARLRKMNDYDISTQAKMTELQTILDEWMSSINEDEMMRLENEMQNRSTDYYKKHMRELVSTGIVKIDLDGLKIQSSGRVPGSLINQFAMDEYDGYLRVATTIGDNWWGFGNQGTSANDVYVLDKNLSIKGSVTNLGLDERIYSVRFVGETGYLVTFRQVDPFYILDLSDAVNPKMTGQLKIPGYSSYLHPVTKDKILGIGMEDGRVKLSYFDVNNPSSPQEIDKYTLADYGSEALYDHHAFLLDSHHQIFFLPSYQGGFVFSYADDKLELVRTVNLNDVKRAVYLDDYLYIIARDYIAVLDENNWEKINELDLSK